MEYRNRHINKFNYYLLLGISTFQFLFILSISIICIINKYSKIFIHITNWSFFLSTFYLFSSLACDTSLYFFSSKKLEKFNYFIRNKFSTIAFPYCFMISIGFWLILLIGFIIGTDTFKKSDTKITIPMVLINIHLHLGITVIMVIELFLSEKEEAKLNWLSSITNTFIFVIYCIIVCIAKFNFDNNAYVFMEDLKIGELILIGIAIYGLLIGCYFLYNYISNKINNKYFRSIERGERDELIENEGINEENGGLIPE